jgi:hypothetical protein
MMEWSLLALPRTGAMFQCQKLEKVPRTELSSKRAPILVPQLKISVAQAKAWILLIMSF